MGEDIRFPTGHGTPINPNLVSDDDRHQNKATAVMMASVYWLDDEL